MLEEINILNLEFFLHFHVKRAIEEKKCNCVCFIPSIEAVVPSSCFLLFFLSLFVSYSLILVLIYFYLYLLFHPTSALLHLSFLPSSSFSFFRLFFPSPPHIINNFLFHFFLLLLSSPFPCTFYFPFSSNPISFLSVSSFVLLFKNLSVLRSPSFFLSELPSSIFNFLYSLRPQFPAMPA